MHLLFELANVVIIGGYLVLAAYLAPRLDVRYRETKAGGVIFLASCAGTHTGLLLRTHYGLEFDGDHPLWLLLHAVQAVGVVCFVHGLWREYIAVKTRHKMWDHPPPVEQ